MKINVIYTVDESRGGCENSKNESLNNNQFTFFRTQ